MGRCEGHAEGCEQAGDDAGGLAAAPRGAWWFAVALIVVMIASAVFIWEPWPFTSARLFSTVRTAEQGSWEAEALTSDGTRRAVEIEQMSHGYRGFAFTMNEFGGYDDGRRDRICLAWVDGMERDLGIDVGSLTISRRTWDLSRGQRHDSEFTETPRWRCEPSGAVPLDEAGDR